LESEVAVMQTTNVDALDRSVQKTNEWLAAVEQELGSGDRRNAYQALRSVLHALRDRLPPNEVLHLGAQMPALVRGFYLEGWRLAEDPPLVRTRQEFLGAVVADAGRVVFDPEPTVRAVFAVLAQKIAPGEIADVKSALPPSIRELWP
jgi:uncharacterized protein (DUF2267 family)